MRKSISKIRQEEREKAKQRSEGEREKGKGGCQYIKKGEERKYHRKLRLFLKFSKIGAPKNCKTANRAHEYALEPSVTPVHGGGGRQGTVGGARTRRMGPHTPYMEDY